MRKSTSTAGNAASPAAGKVASPAPPARPARGQRLRLLAARHPGPVWGSAGLLGGLAAVLLGWAIARGGQGVPAPIAVVAPPEAMAAKAYAAIRPSVVKVTAYGEPAKKGGEPPEQVGTGVVIVEKGVILTNLHVVLGAKKITVTFSDDSESAAEVKGVRPEHDLAVLQAATVPDDLVAATMRSTRDLQPGDPVVAVGYPFGIGPSASAGVVSGLRREFMSPEGKRLLTNLIQFDASANPGSSGGPLVTAGGEVVGIVTAILNPTHQRVFVGIGFAVPIENAAAAVGLSPF